ncbi:MAG: 4Fe-4S cluster-binding domain-containing protein [bacterium]|nr:4Fe-4S cluster-binding domain-containing protein [bacterium]
MRKENIYPAIQLTDACNKQCTACLRTANQRAHKISQDQFRDYIKDLETLAKTYAVTHQFVTGGEPTIWKDQGKDIVDVLSTIDQLQVVQNLVMPTNGKIFEDIKTAREILTKLSEKISGRVVIGLSIADYQENFDDESGCLALDNLLEVCKDPVIKAVPIVLVTLSVEDDMSERVAKRYPAVFQRITPLAPMGDAEDMKKNCPSFSLAGSDKSSIGSFLPQFTLDVTGKLKISEEEFFAMPNAEIMDRLSLHCHCGQGLFISKGWHYCLPFRDDPYYTLAEIGEMREDTLSSFVNKHPFLRGIREEGLITTVQKMKHQLSKETRDKLDHLFAPETLVPIAYRGCMICKEFYDIGVVGELTRVR